MKKLITKPFLFTGIVLFNRTKKFKVFKIYSNQNQLLQYVVQADSFLGDIINPYGVMRFDRPANILDLSMEAGRKWEITIEKEGMEYLHFKYY